MRVNILSLALYWLRQHSLVSAFAPIKPKTNKSSLKRIRGFQCCPIHGGEIRRQINSLNQSRDNHKSCEMNISSHLKSKTTISRRLLVNGFTSASTIALCDPANAATKAKGAAEYDLEFYMRNLIQGNNDKEGNIQASAPPPSKPSRSLTSNSGSKFIQTIINDELNEDCITIRTLSQMTKIPVNEISQAIISFRSKVSKSFATRIQWKEESIVDEYYFDLTAYSLYRTSAVLISDYKVRSQWVNLIGEEIYKSLEPSIREQNEFKDRPTKLTETIPIMQQILEIFQANNFIDSYRLGDKNDEYRTGSNIFDSYDDEDINSGLSINCLVSLLRPATLTSSLQIVGEGSRFIPEFIGTTLAAMWKREMGLRVEYETYFVDEKYRPNPKDYFPSEQLLQYTIKK